MPLPSSAGLRRSNRRSSFTGVDSRSLWLGVSVSIASACSGAVLEEQDHGAWMPTLRVEVPLEHESDAPAERSQHIEFAASFVEGSMDALDYEFGEVQASWAGCRTTESGVRGVGFVGVGYAQYEFEWNGTYPTRFEVGGLSLPVGVAMEVPFGGHFEFALRAQLALVLSDEIAQSRQLEAGIGWRVADGFTVLLGWRWWMLEASALGDPVFTEVDLDVDGPIVVLRLQL